jgi:hypothetical protein
MSSNFSCSLLRSGKPSPFPHFEEAHVITVIMDMRMLEIDAYVAMAVSNEVDG